MYYSIFIKLAVFINWYLFFTSSEPLIKKMIKRQMINEKLIYC